VFYMMPLECSYNQLQNCGRWDTLIQVSLKHWYLFSRLHCCRFPVNTMTASLLTICLCTVVKMWKTVVPN